MTDESDGPRLRAVDFNPLVWLAGDDVLGRLLGREPSAENLLDFLRGPAAKTSMEELRARYAEISTFDRVIVALPAHPTVRASILIPLHNAKAAYVLGHFASCIALGGMLAEMLAIFRFEIASEERRRSGQPTAAEFAGLGQQERIDVLTRMSLIDSRASALLTGIRGRRRRYMHRLRADDRQAKGDAKAVYCAAVDLTRLVFGVGIQGKSLTFHEDVIRMLQMEEQRNVESPPSSES